MSSQHLPPRYAALVARLSGERSQAEWRDNLTMVLRSLLDAPVRDLVDADAAARLARRWADDAGLKHTRAALTRTVSDLARAVLVRDERELGALVSPAARGKLEALAREADLVPERFLRELAESDAATAVMEDVLFEALTEFSEKVNPFFAEWGLPALLKRVPFGAGVVLKSLEGVRSEFDKRLEPETRKFLQGFSRRSTEKALSFALSRGDSPAFVSLRKSILRMALAQKIAATVPPPGDARGDAIEDVALEVSERVYAEAADRAPERLSLLLQGVGNLTVAEALDAAGVPRSAAISVIDQLAPVLADVLWPVVQTVLSRGALSAFAVDVLQAVDAAAPPEK